LLPPFGFPAGFLPAAVGAFGFFCAKAGVLAIESDMRPAADAMKSLRNTE
jgi:hypothetical protein